VLPQICLVDPFPDPARPGLIVTEGTVVDAERNEIWMVVTAEAPPEALERPLALLFGASLPAATDLELLLEGYGLWLAKTPSPDPQLQGLELPPLLQAEGELRGAMALSFVAFLIDREKEEGLRRLLGTATTGRLEVAVQEVYGLDTNSLEAAWRDHVQSGGPKVRPRQFLKLSLQYLKPHKFKQAEIFVYMLFALGFNMVFPFATRALFDTALPSGEFSQVLRLLVGLAVVFVISMLAGLRQTYLSAWISGAVVRDVRGGMYDKLQDLPAAWYKRHQQGDVLTRLFSDVMVVEQGLTSTLRDGLFQMLSLVVSGIVMLTISPLLGVIVLVGAPLVAIVYRVMGKGAQKRGLALQEDTGALMGVAAENYAAEPVVKTFSLQNRERERFGRLSARLFRSERRLTLFGGIFGLSVNMIVTVLRLLVLGLGSWFILQGSFTIGGLVAFLGIMGEVLSPVTVLTGIGQQSQAATGGLHRIDEVMAETTETDGQAGLPDLAPLQREITFDHVDFSYTAERQVLTDVGGDPRRIPRRLVGPSGSGKSTCLQLLMRLYDPRRRRRALRRRRHPHGDDRVAAPHPGRRLPGELLFDTTIRENIALATSALPRPRSSPPQAVGGARVHRIHAEGLRPWSVSAAACSRAASANVSPSPGRSCATPPCSCSTRPPPRSTRARSARSPPPSTASPPAAPPSPSPTASRRSPTTTSCTSSPRARSSSRAPTRSSSRRAARTPACGASRPVRRWSSRGRRRSTPAARARASRSSRATTPLPADVAGASRPSTWPRASPPDGAGRLLLRGRARVLARRSGRVGHRGRAGHR
jgi:ABC-type protease/lipase transport system fused ATPase/permease subunit